MLSSRAPQGLLLLVAMNGGPAPATAKHGNSNGHAFGGRQCADFGMWRGGDECTHCKSECAA